MRSITFRLSTGALWILCVFTAVPGQEVPALPPGLEEANEPIVPHAMEKEKKKLELAEWLNLTGF